MILKEIKVIDIEVKERIREDMGDIDSLVQSFKDNGIIQTIAVLQLDAETNLEGYSYKLLAGARRYYAAVQAGFETVPARIFDDELSPLEQKSIELYENIHRKDLTYGEEIQLKAAIHKLQIEIHGVKKYTTDKEGWGQADTAKLLGESAMNISYDLELAEASVQIPELLDMKDKTQARKTLEKMKEKIIQEELAKRVLARQDEIGIDAVRRKIIDSFIVTDFFDGIKDVIPESIDFIDFDAPWGIGIEDLKMGDGSERHSGVSTKQDYERIEAEGYPEFITKAFKECYRVLKKNAWMVVWFGPEPWFETVYLALTDAGFTLRRKICVWSKGAGQSRVADRYLASSHEQFFYARKGDAFLAKRGKIDVFNYKVVHPDKRSHLTEKPVELMQDIIETFATVGSRILVPFLGSGNSLLASANLGIDAFGFEKVESLKNAFIEKVVSGEPPNYVSY